MDILHLSDMHFGNDAAPFSNTLLAEALSSYVLDNCLKPVIVLSGDVSYRGGEKGFREATEFFSNFIEMTGIDGSKVVACPGNHDIVESSFQAFDRFIYGVRKDSLCAFSAENYKKIELDGVEFYLINSSFHLDHKFGLIDDEFFNVSFSDNKENIKVVVFHHHMLNIVKDDTSALRNAYGLVQHLDNQGVSYILHGHQHAEQSFVLGESRMKVFSVRSGNFLQAGHINGVNHYKLDLPGRKECVKFLAYEKDGTAVKVREIK